MALESGNWQAASTAINSAARELLRTGRGKTLIAWIAALPPTVSEPQPWLAYWQGLAKVQTDELAAREAFERAYQGFAGQRDLLAQTLCASVFVQALYSDWGNFKGLKIWTERIAAGFARDPVFPSAGADLCASTGYLCVAIATAAGGEPVAAKARHVRGLLDTLRGELDPTEWLLAAETLLRYLVYVGQRAATGETEAIYKGLLAS